MADVQAATAVDPKDHSRPAERKRIKETVVLVEKDARTGKTIRIQQVGPNLVTDAGDRYYAQRGAVEAVTHTFNLGEMVVAKSGPVNTKTRTFGNFTGLGSTYTGRKTFSAGYPKTADSDTDNTGRTIDAVTYKTIYGTTEANYTIRAVGICRRTAATNSNGQLLSYKTLATANYVQKTSSITLTVYINHTFLGV